jgi:hypothetical protein
MRCQACYCDGTDLVPNRHVARSTEMVGPLEGPSWFCGCGKTDGTDSLDGEVYPKGRLGKDPTTEERLKGST